MENEVKYRRCMTKIDFDASQEHALCFGKKSYDKYEKCRVKAEKNLINSCEKKSNKDLKAFRNCFTNPSSDYLDQLQKCRSLNLFDKRAGRIIDVQSAEQQKRFRCHDLVLKKTTDTKEQCESSSVSSNKGTLENEVKYQRCKNKFNFEFMAELDHCLGKQPNEKLKKCMSETEETLIARCEKQARNKNAEQFRECVTNPSQDFVEQLIKCRRLSSIQKSKDQHV